MLKTLIRSWILLGYTPTGQFNQPSTLYRQGTELRFLSRAASCFPTDRLKKLAVALAPMPPCFYIQPRIQRGLRRNAVHGDYFCLLRRRQERAKVNYDEIRRFTYVNQR